MPAWDRLESQIRLFKSFEEFTDHSFVHSVNVYDNKSFKDHSDAFVSYIEKVDYEYPWNYTRGDFPNAWEGMNNMWSSVLHDDSCKYVLKIDSDVEFTRPWIEHVFDVISKEKIGSLRYGTRKSGDGFFDLSINSNGTSGGLKCFKKELFEPIKGDHRFFGSEGLSQKILRKGYKTVAIETGINITDVRYVRP